MANIISMKITLGKRKVKNEMYSLYIQFYKGSVVENGKRKILRDRKTLNIFIHQNPKTPIEKRENTENLALAKKILSIQQAEYYQGKYKLKNTRKGKRLFLDFFEEKAEEKINSLKNYGTWTSTLYHLKKCISPSTIFEEIDQEFCDRIRKYFESEAVTKSNVPLSDNTKYTYFNKFKAAIRSAYNEGYLITNYATKLKSFTLPESKREYLTLAEVQTLASTYCKIDVLKRAFLFSCLTGVRWSDINLMTWSEIRDDENGARFLFRQKKTDGVEYLHLSPQARELLGNRGFPEDRVFVGLKYGVTFNREILRWCNRAGITKHITFHCARHTHAVLQLENGTDIFTLSKRLGHREIRTTQVYAKIVDSKMKESANVIPKLNIKL